MNRRILRAAVGGLVLSGVMFSGLAGAQQAPASGAQPADKAKGDLALPAVRIGKDTLSLEYLVGALTTGTPGGRENLNDPGQRQEMVDRVINMELLAGEARRRGYLEQNEIQLAYKNQLASLMHRRITDEIGDPEPTEEELRAFYNENIDKYKKPERMRARHILITNQAKAEKLLAAVAGRSPSQHEFKRLAQENSEDESTRLRGGDLSFFARPGQAITGDPQVDPEVATAAFELKENGSVYPRLVKSARGYHVIMRTGHREALELTFEQARDRLSVLVRRANKKSRVEDAVNALKARYPVQVFEENLKEVVIDLSSGPPEPEAAGALTPTERKRRQKKLLKAGDIDKKIEETNKKIVR